VPHVFVLPLACILSGKHARVGLCLSCHVSVLNQAFENSLPSTQTSTLTSGSSCVQLEHRHALTAALDSMAPADQPVLEGVPVIDASQFLAQVREVRCKQRQSLVCSAVAAALDLLLLLFMFHCLRTLFLPPYQQLSAVRNTALSPHPIHRICCPKFDRMLHTRWSLACLLYPDCSCCCPAAATNPRP
jgi:hypothetical protein